MVPRGFRRRYPFPPRIVPTLQCLTLEWLRKTIGRSFKEDPVCFRVPQHNPKNAPHSKNHRPEGDKGKPSKSPGQTPPRDAKSSPTGAKSQKPWHPHSQTPYCEQPKPKTLPPPHLSFVAQTQSAGMPTLRRTQPQ